MEEKNQVQLDAQFVRGSYRTRCNQRFSSPKELPKAVAAAGPAQPLPQVRTRHGATPAILTDAKLSKKARGWTIPLTTFPSPIKRPMPTTQVAHTNFTSIASVGLCYTPDDLSDSRAVPVPTDVGRRFPSEAGPSSEPTWGSTSQMTAPEYQVPLYVISPCI